MNPAHRHVVEGGYLADILDQPRALRETAAVLETPPALSQLANRLAAGEFTRVVLTGMGSSFHALHPLHIELIAHGFPSIMVETSELLSHLSPLLRERTLHVVVSQSGASVEIVRLLGMVPPGTSVIAVTNTVDSPLAKQTAATLFTRAGRESTVSCKTYLTALQVLSWLSGILRGEPLEPLAAHLRQAGPTVATYLQNWRAHVAALQAQLTGIRHLFLVGRGPSLASAGVGGLILKESTHLPAEGMSSAAFRHGPFEMLHPEMFVGVFLGESRTAALNQRLVEDIVRAGGRAAAIAETVTDGPLRIPAASERLRPILEMLPVEMISLALAANAGREAGKFERAAKITTVE